MPEVAPVVQQKTEQDHIAALKKNKDQYADGKAAGVWDVFVGDREARAKNIKSFLVEILRQNGCKRVLDAACGTGVDSIVLLEEGFEVVSVDASDQMLKSAFKERWNRRKEAAFDNWVIQQGNWLSLYDDIEKNVEDGFDAIICLGSSFSHLHDTKGDQKEHKQAIGNFMKCLKPGGLLLIDHRNYDQVIKIGNTNESDYNKNVYYNATHNTPVRINTQIHYENGKPKVVTRDYYVGEESDVTVLNFSFHPHTLDSFTLLMKSVFGDSAPHKVYGDFKPVNEVEVPTYYIHQIQKSKD